MQADLGLSDAQVAQVKALQDKRMAERKAQAPQIQAERKAKMEQWKAKKEQHMAEMKKILSPEQYKKWEAQKQEQIDRRGKKMHDMQTVSYTHLDVYKRQVSEENQLYLKAMVVLETTIQEREKIPSEIQLLKEK